MNPLTPTSRMSLLSAAVALLFAGGLVGLATVDSDDGDDAALTTVTSPTTSAPTTSSSPALTASSAPSTTAATVAAAGTTSTTVAGSGLGTGGSATVSGSGQMAETGAESLLWPGLGLLGLGLAGRRLRR